MAIVLPRTPINDRKLISQVIASFIIDLVQEDNVSYAEKNEAIKRIKACSVDQIYNLYLGLANGEISGDLYAGRLIQKSVNMSYSAGLFGLSSNVKRQLAYDVQRELQNM